MHFKTFPVGMQVDFKKEAQLLFLCASTTATEDRVSQIQFLIDEANVDVNCVDEHGNNCLLLLCRMNRCEDLFPCVKTILECKRFVGINHRNTQGWDALLLLCRFHSDENLIDLIQLLIQHGIELNARSNDGWSALLLLCRHYNNNNLIDLVELLLTHKVDINCLTAFDTNALCLLCRYYNCSNLPEIIRLLVNKGIDINRQNKDRRNALVILCRFRGSENLIECIRILVESGADIHSADHDGWNALQFLCNNYPRDDLLGAVRLLVGNYCSVFIDKTSKGMTALEALSRNWSGLFHSMLDEVSHWFDSYPPDAQSLGRVILNASQLGCVKSVLQLSTYLSAVPVHRDHKQGEPCDFLEEVLNNSFSICKVCPPIKQSQIDSLRNKLVYTPRILVSPVSFRKVFKNKVKYDDKSTYRHEGRPRHVTLPAYSKWLRLLSAWHDGDTITFDKIEAYLERYSHPQCCGANCSWCLVARDVDIYLGQLFDRMKEMDPLFEMEYVQGYGSSSEKTDIFAPCEFDRLVVPKHFRRSSSNPKLVYYAGTCHQTNLSTNESINSTSLLLHVYKLINAAKDSVFSASFFGPIVGYSETCVTIHFLYRGRKSPEIKASVDITVGVRMETLEQVEDAGCLYSLLVPSRREDGSHWKVSHALFERDLLLKGEEIVAKVFRMLKVLVAVQHAKDCRKSYIPRRRFPSSYALKTCLIQYILDCPPITWQPGDVILHTLNVLHRYPTNSSKMSSPLNKDITIDVTQKSKNCVLAIIRKLTNIIKSEVAG